MLTKDLLKYTVRADKIFPKYVKPNDAEALVLGRFLVDLYGASKQQKQQDLLEKIKCHPKGMSVLFNGLNKLLEDRCEFADSETELEGRRWDLFSKARELRHSKVMGIAEFQATLAQSVAMDFGQLEGQLYGDLPEFRVIQAFDPIDPADLIHRYNAAQVQGLILRSRTLSIIVSDKDPVKKRRFLQRLKFWRLLAEIDDSQDSLKIDLSGPLSLFDKSATYGSRLSNFFPNILLMDKWAIKAEIKILEKTLVLDLDSSKPIKSHYGSFKGYIPAEFKEFIDIFNSLTTAQRKGWTAMEGEDILNLGQQCYSVPDISFADARGQKIHLELFHKWHEVQLKQRLEAMRAGTGKALILGVAAELLPRDKLGEWLGQAEAPAVKVFTFKRFPTPKAILAYLS